MAVSKRISCAFQSILLEKFSEWASLFPCDAPAHTLNKYPAVKVLLHAYNSCHFTFNVVSKKNHANMAYKPTFLWTVAQHNWKEKKKRSIWRHSKENEGTVGKFTYTDSYSMQSLNAAAWSLFWNMLLKWWISFVFCFVCFQNSHHCKLSKVAFGEKKILHTLFEPQNCLFCFKEERNNHLL